MVLLISKATGVRPAPLELQSPPHITAPFDLRNRPRLTLLNMAEGGEYHAPNTAANGNGDSVGQKTQRSSDEQPPLEQVESILRSRANTPNPFSRQHTSLDLDDYFVSFIHQIRYCWDSSITTPVGGIASRCAPLDLMSHC